MNRFTTYDYKDGNGKIVIIMNDLPCFGKTVIQGIRVSDGKKMLSDDRARACDSLEDAIDVFAEMMNVFL